MNALFSDTHRNGQILRLTALVSTGGVEYQDCYPEDLSVSVSFINTQHKNIRLWFGDEICCCVQLTSQMLILQTKIPLPLEPVFQNICLAPVAQMVEHSAWVQGFWVQVPPRLRHFLFQTLCHLLKNILSSYENEMLSTHS